MEDIDNKKILMISHSNTDRKKGCIEKAVEKMRFIAIVILIMTFCNQACSSKINTTSLNEMLTYVIKKQISDRITLAYNRETMTNVRTRTASAKYISKKKNFFRRVTKHWTH